MSAEELDEEIGRMTMRYFDNYEYGFEELMEDWKKIYDQQAAEISRLREELKKAKDYIRECQYDE